MAFISAAVGFNNCVAMIMAVFLVVSPLKMGHTLYKGWQKNAEASTVAESQQNEGGEKEEKDEGDHGAEAR